MCELFDFWGHQAAFLYFESYIDVASNGRCPVIVVWVCVSWFDVLKKSCVVGVFFIENVDMFYTHMLKQG